MRDRPVVEQASARGYRSAKSVDERHVLLWAEIAGLVEISTDGSWTPTARAIEYIERRNDPNLAGAQSATVGLF